MGRFATTRLVPQLYPDKHWFGYKSDPPLFCHPGADHVEARQPEGPDHPQDQGEHPQIFVQPVDQDHLGHEDAHHRLVPPWPGHATGDLATRGADGLERSAGVIRRMGFHDGKSIVRFPSWQVISLLPPSQFSAHPQSRHALSKT